MTRDIAARRAYEHHLRAEHGYSKREAIRAACRTPASDCLRALPLWTRLRIVLSCRR